MTQYSYINYLEAEKQLSEALNTAYTKVRDVTRYQGYALFAVLMLPLIILSRIYGDVVNRFVDGLITSSHLTLIGLVIALPTLMVLLLHGCICWCEWMAYLPVRRQRRRVAKLRLWFHSLSTP